MTIKFVMFPSTGGLARLNMDLEPGMTIKELEDKLLAIEGFVIREEELVMSNCSVDGLMAERDYAITGEEKEISFVNQALGQC